MKLILVTTSSALETRDGELWLDGSLLTTGRPDEIEDVAEYLRTGDGEGLRATRLRSALLPPRTARALRAVK